MMVILCDYDDDTQEEVSARNVSLYIDMVSP
jgi:hypothetical protein